MIRSVPATAAAPKMMLRVLAAPSAAAGCAPNSGATSRAALATIDAVRKRIMIAEPPWGKVSPILPARPTRNNRSAWLLRQPVQLTGEAGALRHGRRQTTPDN